MGIRVGRKDSLVKNMSSKVANGFRRLMTKDGVKDTGCPLKILHTEYAQRIPFFTGMHRFLPALIPLHSPHNPDRSHRIYVSRGKRVHQSIFLQ